MAKAKKTKTSKVVSKKVKSPAKKAKPAKVAKKVKTVVKKAVANKKTTAKKKAVVKKAAGNKKAVAKKVVAKKAALKKVAVKKTATKKPAVKKPVVAKSKTTASKPVKKSVEKAFTKSLEKALSPLDDRLVVQVEASEKMTAGGLYIPATVSDVSGNLKGLVLAVGRGHMNKKGHVKAMDVQVGQTVLHADYSGTQYNHQGQDVIIIRESDILGILEK